MKKLLCIFSLLVVGFTSCEEDANIDVPEVDPVLVVSCYITPQDSFIRAHVSKSNPIFNSSSNATGAPVTDANVMFYGNSSSVQLVYNSVTEFYEVPTSTFPIIAGNEYHIIVTAPGNMRAEAYTTVPLNSPSGFQCTVTDTIISQDPFYQNGEARFSYSTNDPAGQTNFYRFVVYHKYVDQFGDSTLRRSGWELFSDENADGTAISRNMTTYFYEDGNDSLMGYDVWMMNCNHDYYMFHRSIYSYSGEDPFSEPSMIYSNITDGLGIFAAANSARLQIPR